MDLQDLMISLLRLTTQDNPLTRINMCIFNLKCNREDGYTRGNPRLLRSFPFQNPHLDSSGENYYYTARSRFCARAMKDLKDA